jgi:hypothetical protein
VRWLREPKRWYEPNASTFLEAMDSGQATLPQSAAGVVQLCLVSSHGSSAPQGRAGAERSIRMTLSLAFLTPDFLVAPVFTDPPYNVPMKGHAGGKGRRKHREFPMASEEMTEDAFRRFLEDALGFAAAHSAEDSSVSSPFRRCWCATPLKAALSDETLTVSGPC